MRNSKHEAKENHSEKVLIHWGNDKAEDVANAVDPKVRCSLQVNKVITDQQ